MKKLSLLLVAILSVLTWPRLSLGQEPQSDNADAEPLVIETEGIRYVIDTTDIATCTVVTTTDAALTQVTIPDSVWVDTLAFAVTDIADSAFYGRTRLKSVTLPDSIARIGQAAFGKCTGLTHVDLPAGLHELATAAFTGCSALTEVTLPDSLAAIGGQAFLSCTRLAAIVIPAGVTSIGERAFGNCQRLASVTVAPDNAVYRSEGDCCLTADGSRLVFGCQNSVIPDNVRTMDNSAFYYSTYLTAIDLPEGLTSIGTQAFYGCSRLESIHIPATVTTIGSQALAYCPALARIEVAEGNAKYASAGGCLLSADGKTLIAGCNAPQIPSSVTKIQNYAFRYSSRLTQVKLPPHLTSIGTYAFQGCTSLSHIALPASVTSVGTAAFASCTQLSVLSCATTPPTVTSANAFASGITGTLTVPQGTAEVYASRTGWMKFTDVREEVRGIATDVPDVWQTPDGILYQAHGSEAHLIADTARHSYAGDIAVPARMLTSDTLLTVTAVADSAFFGTEALTGLHLPASVTSVGAYALAACPALATIEVDADHQHFAVVDGCLLTADSLTLIAAGASTVIPETVTRIGDAALYGSRLTSLTLSPAVTYIGHEALAHCTALRYVIAQTDEPCTAEADAFGQPEGVVYVPAAAASRYASAPGWDAFAYHLTYAGEAPVDPYPLIVTEVGYATLYLDHPTSIPLGLTAYAGQETADGQLTLTALLGGVLPAQTGVVVKAAAGAYSFERTDDEPASPITSILAGVTEDTEVAPRSVYVLGLSGGRLGFGLNGSTTLLANRAYLPIPAPIGPSEPEPKAFLTFAFSDDETGLGLPTRIGPSADGPAFDLFGRRLSAHSRGWQVSGQGVRIVLP